MLICVCILYTIEKRRHVHPTGFDVQYRYTDTENSNPNIMISGNAHKPVHMLCRVLNFCILSNYAGYSTSAYYPTYCAVSIVFNFCVVLISGYSRTKTAASHTSLFTCAHVNVTSPAVERDNCSPSGLLSNKKFVVFSFFDVCTLF